MRRAGTLLKNSVDKPRRGSREPLDESGHQNAPERKEDPSYRRRGSTARWSGRSVPPTPSPALSSATKRGLSDKSRPIGSFCSSGLRESVKHRQPKRNWRSFCSTVRVDDPDRHVRIHGKHAVSRRRCASGVRRVRGGGQLTEAVRRKPYSVILFDESKKRI